MLKFMVVIRRRNDRTNQEFENYLREVHGPLARKLPGLKKYVQNFVRTDSKRKTPPWDAIVELYFNDRTTMEAAWATPEGKASGADLPNFVDLTETSWSITEEVVHDPP